MTIAEWLIPSMIRLRDAGVDSPRRDCLVLLEDTVQKDRAWVVAHPEYELEKKVVQHLDALITKRISREPLAYIRGKAWFYGRFFEVIPAVLIPRPESENFIELLKELKPAKIIDIGTGSGALAVTAKLELPESNIIATDTSSTALTIAQKNAAMHTADIQFLFGSLLEPLNDEQLNGSTIVTNLPYVPEALITSPEIIQEPKEALFSGADGLDHYRNFWEQIMERGAVPTFILIESLESQHKDIELLAQKAGYALQKTDILVQEFVRTAGSIAQI
jgi:release factor glutamine methyltransferase